MAEQTAKQKAATAKTAPKKAARKTAPKKAATQRKTATSRKPATKRKTAAQRKPTARTSARRTSTQDIATRAQEAGRAAFLVSLGFYGKAFDEAQERFESLQDRLEKRRKNADKLYRELVKRGEKVEKDARSALDDLDLDNLTDRKKLEARLEKARARLEELRDSVGFKSAA
ncbi:MAG: hypothetical protein U5K56_12525 [Halioglobus sp.]|nr:hypothetical protein [Halioglobus sp.]